MKNLIAILILLISINVFSQAGTGIAPNQQKVADNDAIGNIGFGAAVSAGSTLLVYEGLYRFIDLPQKKAKLISYLSGIAINTTLAYVREQNDMVKGYGYNAEHVKYTIIGGVIGANVTFLIGHDKRRIRQNKKLKKMQNYDR